MKATVAIDSNLLLLLIVGLADKHWISTHGRLDDFAIADFNLLAELIESVDEIVFLPHVLAEVSNLIGFSEDQQGDKLRDVFQTLILESGETYIASKDGVLRREFRWLGLTDSVLLALQESDAAVTLLTDDANLALAASNAKFDVFNFREFRAL